MLAVMRSLAIAGAILGVGAGDQINTAAPKSCRIEGVSPIVFGNYDPIVGSSVDAQSQVSFRCGKSNARSILVQISLGTGAAATFNRRMSGGRDLLRYNVYLDAARNIIWGDGTGGTQVFKESVPPNNKLVTVPVFGRVFSGQDVAADAYSDHLVVTLDF
jgi:spore coat protein U-like protein